MACKDGSDIRLLQLIQQGHSPLERNVEVLIRLIFLRKKQRVMLKQQDVRGFRLLLVPPVETRAISPVLRRAFCG